MGRATAVDAGHSGYGSESIRPHLRAQLRLKEMLAAAFAPPLNPWDRRKKPRAKD